MQETAERAFFCDTGVGNYSTSFWAGSPSAQKIVVSTPHKTLSLPGALGHVFTVWEEAVYHRWGGLRSHWVWGGTANPCRSYSSAEQEPCRCRRATDMAAEICTAGNRKPRRR
jgi:hypothetical protein